MTWSSFFIQDYFKFLRIINPRSWKLWQLWLTVPKTVVNSNPIKLKAKHIFPLVGFSFTKLIKLKAKNIFPLVGFSFTKLIKEMKYWLLVLLSQSILAQCFVSIPPQKCDEIKGFVTFFWSDVEMEYSRLGY